MKFKFYCFIKHTAIAITVLVMLYSCTDKQNKDKEISLKAIVENSLGKKLILPNNLNTYEPFSKYLSDSIGISNSDFKIYSYVNVSCATCVENIELWHKLTPEFSKYDVPVILIFGSDDQFEIIKHLCENGNIKKFPYPFFLDNENSFVKQNKFMNETPHFQTVLTDKNNTILLMGNPLYSKSTKDLYTNTITKKRS